MSCWIVIPVKTPSEAKGRLAGVLAPVQRQALTRIMLSRAVAAAQAANGADALVLIGASRLGQPEDIELLPDPDAGLNGALDFARAELIRRGATRMVTLAADLPLIEASDVEALCAARGNAVAIAPDRHGTGTNALSLPLPAAADFVFTYGPNSCAAHHAEAARLGLEISELCKPGLASDVDEPADLADAAVLGPEWREQT